jgi:hypothetical protein
MLDKDYETPSADLVFSNERSMALVGLAFSSQEGERSLRTA